MVTLMYYQQELCSEENIKSRSGGIIIRLSAVFDCLLSGSSITVTVHKFQSKTFFYPSISYSLGFLNILPGFYNFPPLHQVLSVPVQRTSSFPVIIELHLSSLAEAPAFVTANHNSSTTSSPHTTTLLLCLTWNVSPAGSKVWLIC